MILCQHKELTQPSMKAQPEGAAAQTSRQQEGLIAHVNIIVIIVSYFNVGMQGFY
jgi:hypothetical protein